MRTTTPIQVRFNDIDMAGHVHNAVYLSWFEQGRMEYLAKLIAPGNDWKKQGLIVARNEVDYRRPVHLRDQVEVDCWCARIGSKSFDLHYAVFTVQNKVRQLCTQGRSVMVAMDYTANAAINLPEAWRADLLRMLQPMEG